MARFLVVLFDPSDNSHHRKMVRAASEAEAILLHPWIVDIYRTEWITENIRAEESDDVQDNVYKVLGWVSICVNLDNELLGDINGGEHVVVA